MTFRYSKSGLRDSTSQMKNDRENNEISREVSNILGSRYRYELRQIICYIQYVTYYYYLLNSHRWALEQFHRIKLTTLISSCVGSDVP